MHFILIAAVLTLVAAAQSAPSEPLGHPGLRVLVVAGSCLGLTLLALGASHRTVTLMQRRPQSALETLRRFSRLKTLHLGLVLVNVLLLVAGLQWPQVVNGDLGLAGAVLVDDVLVLAPLVLPLMLAWGAYYDVDRALETMGRGHPGPARASPTPRPRNVPLKQSIWENAGRT